MIPNVLLILGMMGVFISGILVGVEAPRGPTLLMMCFSIFLILAAIWPSDPEPLNPG